MTYFYWAFTVAFAVLFAVTIEVVSTRNDE